MEKNKNQKKDFFTQAALIVGVNYSELAKENISSSENKILDLLNHKCIPREPFDRLTIELLLNKIALMDSNNY